VHLFSHVDGGYYLLGVTLAAGGSRYRDTFAPFLHRANGHGNRSLLGASGVLFLPHLSGERSPHLDPDTRGLICLWHTQAELIRAVLEGVAFSLRAALEVISEITPVHQLWATGGGARSSVWLQFFGRCKQNSLLPKQKKSCFGSSIWQWWGLVRTQI